MCYGLGGLSYVRYRGCSGEYVVTDVVRSDVSIAFDEVCAVVVLKTKTVFKCLVSSVKLPYESQTSCALFVKVLTAVALCDVGL